jgi:hypothetical protein
MPEPKIQYSEYQSVVDLLNKSDQDSVYQDLMKKEDKTLDTINKVIKYYKDNDYKNKQFINMNFWEVILRFGDIWTEIYNDVSNTKKYDISLLSIFLKEDRPIYIGVVLIVISIFIMFIILSD